MKKRVFSVSLKWRLSQSIDFTGFQKTQLVRILSRTLSFQAGLNVLLFLCLGDAENIMI